MTPENQQEKPGQQIGERKLIDDRLAKTARLRAQGIDPYPPRFDRTHTTLEAVKLFEDTEAALGPDPACEHPHTDTIRVAGRVMARRGQGKASFIDLKDGHGPIQVFARQNTMGDAAYALLDLLDIGDIIGVEGAVIRTRRGEISIEATAITVLTKSMRPLPDKWGGLQDQEVRFRQRYLDLISNEKAMKNALLRPNVVRAMRDFMHGRGFVEVETPILVPVAAGAQATPFETHHNQLDRDLYLRIATELYLKKLIVGGIERVFEIGRLFRNEGLDHDHNPEFTTIESYQAYADYDDVMEMVENMVAHIALETTGSMILPALESGRPEIDLTPPWPRLDLRTEIKKRTGIDFAECPDVESLSQAMQEGGIYVEEGSAWGRLLDKVISSEVEPNLVQPHFLVDYPVEMSPLAKRKPGSDGIVERFEAFVAGSELANAFTELNDPVDQRARFEQQERMRSEFDDVEADRLDEDFLIAIEHGMPPTGGLGLGIDRLTMLIAGEESIREILLFPARRGPKYQVGTPVGIRNLSHRPELRGKLGKIIEAEMVRRTPVYRIRMESRLPDGSDEVKDMYERDFVPITNRGQILMNSRVIVNEHASNGWTRGWLGRVSDIQQLPHTLTFSVIADSNIPGLTEQVHDLLPAHINLIGRT
jgi:lysyl-tRNA synthetase class 2